MTLRYASSVVGYPMRLLGRNHFPEPAGGIQDGWGGGGGGGGEGVVKHSSNAC